MTKALTQQNANAADEPTLEPLLECQLCQRWTPEGELSGGACSDCRRASLDAEVVWALSVNWSTMSEAAA